MRCRFRALLVPAAIACLAAAGLSATPSAVAGTQATFINWPAYLLNIKHSSDNKAATAITPASVASLTRVWTWKPAAPTNSGQPPAILLASPTVVNGVVYIGADTGVFYALKEATGTVIWHQFVGFVQGTTCGPLGVVATATVAPDPVTSALTVYVAGGDGYLFALNATTGTIVWKSPIAIPSTTVNDYFDWSSPTVSGGDVYVGVASDCDNPLTPGGGLKEFDQHTGAQLAYYKTLPTATTASPSIWSSAAVNPVTQSVFVTTGNGPAGDAVSIVRLAAGTGLLARKDAWQVPANQHGSDSDFGGSPTLFSASLNGTAVAMIGACNKNGVYYALRQNKLASGPVWQRKVGTAVQSPGQCDAAAIWNGSDLFVAGNQTTIGGVSYPGSIRELNPATGAVLWARGLSGAPTGSPTMDGSGVIAVTGYAIGTGASTLKLTLINAATGKVLRTVTIGPDFGQPVFADNWLLAPTQNNGLWAYKA